jgi:hypothetical protein
MNGKRVLYIDQYGSRFSCSTVKELKTVHHLCGKVSKMYQDGKDGKRYHVGYVVGSHWLTAYTPFRKEA